MRFLCLHGRGTNSDIFESQLAPLRSRLPKHYEFDFIDADIPSKAAPGVGAFHPGPFFAWRRDLPSTKEIAATIDNISAVLEEDGPYDGIIGFSEGAAIAATLLLSPPDGIPPPVKVAVFICSALPLAPSTEVGIDATEYVLEYVRHNLDFFGLTQADIDAWPRSKRMHIYMPLSDKSYKTERVVDSWSAMTSTPRITIPTLHILGTKDPIMGFGRHLASLSDGKKAKVVTCDCGHELPRDETTLETAASLFQELVEMALIDH